MANFIVRLNSIRHPKPRRLQRKHAVLLVLAVLIIHLGLLDLLPRWQRPNTPPETVPKALLTRQIEDRAAHTTSVIPAHPTKPATPRAAAPQDTDTPQDTAPPLARQALDDPSSDLTSPLALPARSASDVDLPPFKRQPEAADGAAQIASVKPPEPALLKYTVQGLAKQLSYYAWGELLWQANATHYEARLEIGAFLLGSRTQTSSGAIGAEGLMPERFIDSSRNAAPVLFQRDQNTLHFNANGSELPLLKGTQDRLSVVLQLSTLLAGEPERYPSGTMLSIPTVSQQDVEVWSLLVEKEESLALPYGTVLALKLSRVPRNPTDQRIEMWFAPSLNYLPVRLRLTNADGDQVDQQLKSLTKPSL